MSTSTDGGLTWGPATPTASSPVELAASLWCSRMETSWCRSRPVAFRRSASTDGGASWSAPVTISNIQTHQDAGGIRSGPLPSAAVDGAGTVWVVWEDCRFRSNCSTNDLVYSTSSDGVNWSAVTRIPIDDIVEHRRSFHSGDWDRSDNFGRDCARGDCIITTIRRATARSSTCQLTVGYISSANGGTTLEYVRSTLTGPTQL